MLPAGIAVMIAGVAGVISSVILEIRFKEPVYILIMKIAPTIFAVGAVLFALGII